MFEKTIPLSVQPVKCPHCGAYSSARNVLCPQCGGLLVVLAPPPTIVTPSAPAAEGAAPPAAPEAPIVAKPPTTTGRKTGLSAFTSVLLQIAPSNAMLSLLLIRPLVLGRGTANDPEEKLDLTNFNAYEQGVSRRHCQFQRRDNTLVISDLGSANGTFLNDERLLPLREYTVAHGDRVTLGQLQFTVFFSKPET